MVCSYLQDDELSSSDDSGNEVDQRRLQLYERSRLRYYYAVVDCQDVRTAAHLYTECDSIEFLRSACKLDMRFVPDEQVRTRQSMIFHVLRRIAHSTNCDIVLMHACLYMHICVYTRYEYYTDIHMCVLLLMCTLQGFAL